MKAHLIQIGLAWLIVLIVWSLFSWLMGADWVGPAIIAILFPVVLGIVMVPYLLTWIADKVRR
jgi:hypothetical protein